MKHSDICKHCLEGWSEHEALKDYCPKYDDGGGLYYDKSQIFERLNIREVVAKVSEQEKEREEHRKAMLGMADDQKALTEQVENLKAENGRLEQRLDVVKKSSSYSEINRVSAELSRLREERNELIEALRMVCRSLPYSKALSPDIKSLLDKFSQDENT